MYTRERLNRLHGSRTPPLLCRMGTGNAGGFPTPPASVDTQTANANNLASGSLGPICPQRRGFPQADRFPADASETWPSNGV